MSTTFNNNVSIYCENIGLINPSELHEFNNEISRKDQFDIKCGSGAIKTDCLLIQCKSTGRIFVDDRIIFKLMFQVDAQKIGNIYINKKFISEMVNF